MANRESAPRDIIGWFSRKPTDRTTPPLPYPLRADRPAKMYRRGTPFLANQVLRVVQVKEQAQQHYILRLSDKLQPGGVSIGRPPGYQRYWANQMGHILLGTVFSFQ